ncbi:Chemotaxis protein CheY [Andreprevotia sp. IGB-42]|uniref:response regulator n=1 Tax=Andreprevotia sp. IGB-42 TaxID=2497473 RepID=UPI001359987B|nr:response regulator [Andreprevotia sp. IGB-42]KAF0814566.1 Chemotaxis protein CheY [Andreprevotia sp. IGB-42]
MANIQGAPNLTGQQALVIDPNSGMRQAIGAGLNDCGVTQIDYVSRLADAMARLGQTPYDIVLSEFDLGGGLDGVHLFEACHRHQLLKPSCVFMVVTGERRSSQVMSAAELAPDGYLLKPFSSADFVQRLMIALARKAQLRPIDEATRTGDYLAAIAACDAVQPQPDTLARAKGRLLTLLGEHVQARDFYREVLASRDAPWAMLGLARSQFALRQYDEAQLLYERVRTEHDLVIEAYDGLARTLQALGDAQGAQAVLADAVQRSPLVAQRQRALGRLALRNGERAVAEGALAQAVELARTAITRDPAVYSELARAQLANADVLGAQRTAAQVKRDFRHDEVALVVSDLIEGEAFAALKERDKAERSLTAARERLDAMADVPAGVLLELAHSCYARRDVESGERYVKHALRVRNDDAEVAGAVEALYHGIGRPELAAPLIQSANQDIVEVNNEAVRAANAGDYAGAAERFISALETLPGNLQVLLNAANALLVCVNKAGWDVRYMETAQQYLERARRLDPSNGKARQLQDAFRRTQRRYGVDAALLQNDAAPPAPSVDSKA